MTTETAPHIRRRLPKRGGNNFYKARINEDWLDRHVRTFCGAEPTDRDVSWAGRRTKWTRENACPACVTALSEDA